MKILVVGGGGREHAIVDKLDRDAPDAELFAAPGNPGMAALARCVPIAADDIEGLVVFVRDRSIDLTVVGPEAPLARGLVDRLEALGFPVFGPTRAAARLESSKAFAKELMRRAGVSTAGFAVFDRAEEARAHIRNHPEPLVVKASGLAAGKGAIVCETRNDALAAVDELMVEGRFGDAGARVVVEEFMEGIELSVFFLADGERAVPLLTSRDYKRIGEGDRGPNTGGMGAYAPAAPGGADAVETIRRRIAMPVLEAMAEAGTPYRGFLYAGLMLTDQGPRVVEFNCRLGDPETQAVLPIMRTPLLDPMLAVATSGSVAENVAAAADGYALVTVLASAGYPESSDPGRPIEIPDFDPAEVRVYHAGTAVAEDRLVTAGGRVLGVTGIGSTLEEAATRSREAAESIRFEGMQWRTDIGWHELTPDRMSPARRRLLDGL